LATDVPSADRSYFTVASVDEVSFTESTLDVTADASGLDAKSLSAVAKSDPFCSSCSRLLVEVAVLKNAFQLAVICETALDEPLAVTAGDADGGTDADAAVEVTSEADDPGVDEEELALLEQAATAVTSTRPSAGAR
jgi:hypothetical protein